MIDDENDPETDAPETEDAVESDEGAASEKAPRKRKISYENTLPRDEAVSYFEAIVTGLKKGQLEFRQEDESVTMDLPDRVDVEVKASRNEKKGKISFELSWKNTGSPDLAIVSD